MHCPYCGSINEEDDHRCLRCGRRMKGIAIAAPPSYIGATALAMSLLPGEETERAMAPARAENPQQPPLFGAPQLPPQKVIPFEQIQRQAGNRPPAQPPSPGQKPAVPPRASAKKPGPPAGRTKASQGSLDFHSGPQGERILATGVPAQVYGESMVAPPVRRMTAGAMDVSMVLLGFGLFAGGTRLAASYLASSSSAAAAPSVGFGAGKAAWIALAASLVLISLFYGLIWAVARRETAGMNWTRLQLVTFDGSPLEARDRAIRFIAVWLSFCSGGLGLLWALADEENLTFHDHISKTYPAEKDSDGILVRPRG